MDRNQANQLLPIIKAFSEGKPIQSRCIKGDTSLWYEDEDPNFDDDDLEYRIKPEPKYRPFKDTEECWNEMQKHQPFGYVKEKVSKAFYCIGSFDVANIYVGTTNIIHSYADSLKNFTFADGSPFGVKVEE